MTEKTILSIITPVLNGDKWIEKNILAIQRLNIPYEHIIVDGGSTDETLKIIKKYQKVKLISQHAGGGMYEAIDMGFKEVAGQLITWVNCDDYIISDGFEKMYFRIADNPSIGLVYSDSIINNEVMNEISISQAALFGKYFIKKGILPFVQPSSIFRRSLYFESGGFDYQNFKICGDLELFIKMSLHKKYSFNYIPAVSSVFLVYGNSLGDLNTEKYKKEFLSLKTVKTNNVVTRMLFKLAKTANIRGILNNSRIKIIYNTSLENLKKYN